MSSNPPLRAALLRDVAPGLGLAVLYHALHALLPRS